MMMVVVAVIIIILPIITVIITHYSIATVVIQTDYNGFLQLFADLIVNEYRDRDLRGIGDMMAGKGADVGLQSFPNQSDFICRSSGVAREEVYMNET